MLKKLLKLTTFSSFTALVAVANASVPATPLSGDDASAQQVIVATPQVQKTLPKTSEIAAPFPAAKTAPAVKHTPDIAKPFTSPSAPVSVAKPVQAKPDNNIPLHAVQPMEQSRARNDLFSEDNHFYLGADFTYEYFNSPDFGMGSPGTESIQRHAMYNAKPTQFTFAPTAKIGYRFSNDFLTGLFGHHANAELDLTGFNSGASDSSNAQHIGAAWKITGGAIGAVPSEGEETYLRNFKFHSSIHYKNISLYYQGEHITTNPHLEMQPFIDLVYTRLTQNYAANMELNSTDTPTPDPTGWSLDKVNEDLATNYWGIGFGNNLDYRFTPRFGFLTNFEVQLLYADSNLSANQVANVQLDEQYHVRDSSNKFTYRAKIAMGPEFRFQATDTSPSVHLLVGLDQWGYMPEVYNPRGAADTGKAHIVNSNQLSPFVSLGFKFPLA